MQAPHIAWPRSALGCAKLVYVDYEAIASELVRAWRGRRSQPAFSRRLGYKSNVVYRWESRRAWPTAAAAFRAAERAGVDLRGGLARFYRRPPAWLARADLKQPEDVARLLDELRGQTPIGELARRAGRSRFAVARWLKGEAEPRLPELLRMIEATSLRLLDFLALLADPAKLPSVAGRYRELVAAREAAYSLPWSHAVLRVLELAEYRALPRHETGWIARRLGIPREEEERCLGHLVASGQVRRVKRHYVVDSTRLVDTRDDPERSQKLREFWARVALERVERGSEHVFSYNLFSASHADVARIRELYRSFFQQVRSIVAQSEPNEAVVLLCTQLVPIEPSAAERRA